MTHRRRSLLATLTLAAPLAAQTPAPTQPPARQPGAPAGAPAGAPGARPGAAALAAQQPGQLTGLVVGSAASQPIPSASITVRAMGADTSIVAGALARADGTFRIDGLRPGRYSVRVRALGYSPMLRTDVAVTAAQPRVELGRFALEQVAAQLSGVQVQAEREAAALAPDRNSYAVKDMPATSGGTAVDVLRNVPSVEVDGDNKVSLRGSGNVIVQINGRASPMRAEALGNFLAQLPANVVNKVEVVSNPSAKNDPEGMAGIINVVLKQEADLGTSGGAQLGGGSTQQLNGSANLGHQAGPWTFFSSYGYMQDRRTVEGFSTRAAIADPGSLDADLQGVMRPRSHSATLTAEYRANAVHTLSNNLVVNRRGMNRDNDSFYRDVDANGDVQFRTNQLTDQRQRDLTFDEALTWRRTIHPQKNALSVEARVNYGRGTNDVLLTSETPDDANPTGLETNGTLDRNRSVFAQSDWTRELREGTKLESGYKGTFRRQSTDFDVTTGEMGGSMTPDASRINAFTYDEQIHAVYAVLSQRARMLNLQAGLRLEAADTRFDLRTTSQSYDNDYRSAFPSAIVSWDLDAKRQMKASYSRRINRPFAQQLNPFGFREDAVTVFEGNPALKPEYTDSYELGWQQALSTRGTLQLTPFFRHTTDAVRQYSFVDGDGVLHMSARNAATSDQYGADANVTFRLGPVNGFGGASLFQMATEGDALTGTRDVRAMVWSTRANATWRVSPTLDLQGFANYRSPMRTEQGRMSRFALTNFAVRQKLNGDKTTMTLRVMDPFGTMGWTMRTNDGRVVQLMDRRFGARGAFLSVNYAFGTAPRLRPRPAEEQPAQQGGQPGVP